MNKILKLLKENPIQLPQDYIKNNNNSSNNVDNNNNNYNKLSSIFNNYDYDSISLTVGKGEVPSLSGGCCCWYYYYHYYYLLLSLLFLLTMSVTIILCIILCNWSYNNYSVDQLLLIFECHIDNNNNKIKLQQQGSTFHSHRQSLTELLVGRKHCEI